MSVAPTMNGDSRKGYSPREKSPSSAPATFYTPSPRVSEQPSSRIWRSGQAFHYPLPGSGNHWKECKDRVDQFDQDFCAGWNSEIDSLLTFAGLFSAVVTAFTIESYKWLQPDSQT
ncbi:hypothetical protein BD779DRAFT_1676698 [Infundibulicybe gibba]|nr:hypothetical protein BD779DRAFT_1676698 [Infundibulicybe gibba]